MEISHDGHRFYGLGEESTSLRTWSILESFRFLIYFPIRATRMQLREISILGGR